MTSPEVFVALITVAVANSIFEPGTHHTGSTSCWAPHAPAFQITVTSPKNIARALKMMGIELLRTSASHSVIREFWRHWHISLDLAPTIIPLEVTGAAQTDRNLLITMVLEAVARCGWMFVPKFSLAPHRVSLSAGSVVQRWLEPPAARAFGWA